MINKDFPVIVGRIDILPEYQKSRKSAIEALDREINWLRSDMLKEIDKLFPQHNG